MSIKKLLIAVISLLCTITIGISTTVAYFISNTGPVINTFTVGNVSLSLSETTGTEYQMIPGTTIAKDPLVTVHGGSEECLVYVKLERVNGFDDYVTFEIADGWTKLGGFDGIYYRTVEKSGVDKVYNVIKGNKITIKNNLSKEKMAAIDTQNLPEINITAFAIQTLGIESAADGWYNILSVYGGD